MSTPLTQFYTPLRAILGDRDPFGVFAYSDADLGTALTIPFLTGGAPEGYMLDGSGNITPTLPLGAPFGQVLFGAALILITGEDGQSSMRTRALSVSDGGDRKRDLTTQLRLWIAALDTAGGLAFECSQQLSVLLENLAHCNLLDRVDAGYIRLPYPLSGPPRTSP